MQEKLQEVEGCVDKLSDILQFVTAASEEPVLGFVKLPEIHFIIPLETETGDTNEQGATPQVVSGFMPVAHSVEMY